jgi:two-component system, OmpR family, response regulator
MAAEEKRVYMLTAKGNAELTAARTSLGAAELKLLVMIDGIATVEQIAKRTDSADVAAVAKALQAMAKIGHIADPDGTAAIDVKNFFKEVDTSVSSLQSNGFFVRIARRAPEGAKAGQKITVLVVEDDPQLAKLLRTYLKMEDFTVRLAANREEVTRALNEATRPDLVLLDVVLPDADGFEILEKMRAHDGLKNVPIIMATAKATREAVLQGLRRGANGYVTKPYDVQILMSAIRTVLGLK